MKRTALWAGLFCILFLARDSFGQCQYEAIAMEELCNGGWGPRGVNDHSVVVGGRNGCTSANYAPFIWTERAGTTYLPVPAGQGIVSSWAVRISDDGTIAGLAETSNALDNLIVWRTDGTVAMYMPAGGPATVSRPAIRHDGAILGEYQTGFPGGVKGFILKEEKYLPLPSPLAEDQGGFKAVNRSGWATGRHFVWSKGLEDQPILWDGESDALLLGLPPGFVRGYGMEIDCFGRIACEIRQEPTRKSTLQAWRAFIWESGTYTVLPLLPTFEWMTVRGMNDVGQVIGECSKPGPPMPYVSQHGVTLPLWAQVAPPLPGLLAVSDINERGEIVTMTQGQMYLLRPLGVVPADVDINCRVDVNDLDYVVRCWGPVGPTTAERADVNGDGRVDAADLAEVLGAWTP